MSEARRTCFETLSNSGLQVQFVTAKNLSSFILPEHPLHRGYLYLSETHRADYLRAYFMHFYGGGYSDIKKISRSWIPALNKLKNKPSFFVNGYREIGPHGVPDIVGDKKLDLILHKHWDNLIGMGNFIFRPHTAFTSEWYSKVIQKMNEKLHLLEQYPARSPQQIYSADYPYPFRWAELLGEIFHPLCYKYRRHILQSLPMFVPSDYR